MVKSFGFLLVAGVIAVGSFFSSVRAEDAMPTTQPTTKPALACCGDACNKMGKCCSADDMGKVTCPMGGSCCKKADVKPMDGMKMDK